MRASTVEFVVFVAIAVAVTTYRWLASPERANRRRLVDTERTPLHQLRPGIARVTGKVRRGREILEAPISKRPCVAFEVRIEQHDSEDWSEKVRIRDARAFTVVDETGEALVDPAARFELLLQPDVRGSRTWFEEPPPQESSAVEALLHARGIRTVTRFFERPIRTRYFEGIVEEGELVSVYGPVVEAVHPEGEKVAPRSVPVARILRGTREEPVRIGDGPVALEGLATSRSTPDPAPPRS